MPRKIRPQNLSTVMYLEFYISKNRVFFTFVEILILNIDKGILMILELKNELFNHYKKEQAITSSACISRQFSIVSFFSLSIITCLTRKTPGFS